MGATSCSRTRPLSLLPQFRPSYKTKKSGGDTKPKRRQPLEVRLVRHCARFCWVLQNTITPHSERPYRAIHRPPEPASKQRGILHRILAVQPRYFRQPIERSWPTEYSPGVWRAHSSAHSCGKVFCRACSSTQDRNKPKNSQIGLYPLAQPLVA